MVDVEVPLHAVDRAQLAERLQPQQEQVLSGRALTNEEISYIRSKALVRQEIHLLIKQEAKFIPTMAYSNALKVHLTTCWW